MVLGRCVVVDFLRDRAQRHAGHGANHFDGDRTSDGTSCRECCSFGSGTEERSRSSEASAIHAQVAIGDQDVEDEEITAIDQNDAIGRGDAFASSADLSDRRECLVRVRVDRDELEERLVEHQ